MLYHFGIITFVLGQIAHGVSVCQARTIIVAVTETVIIASTPTNVLSTLSSSLTEPSSALTTLNATLTTLRSALTTDTLSVTENLFTTDTSFTTETFSATVTSSTTEIFSTTDTSSTTKTFSTRDISFTTEVFSTTDTSSTTETFSATVTSSTTETFSATVTSITTEIFSITDVSSTTQTISTTVTSTATASTSVIVPIGSDAVCPQKNNTHYIADDGSRYILYCDMDLPGNTLSNSSSPDLETCIDACHANPYCTGATWALNDHYNSTCFLKGGGVDNPTSADHVSESAFLICSSTPLLSPNIDYDYKSTGSNAWVYSGSSGSSTHDEYGYFPGDYEEVEIQTGVYAYLAFNQTVTTCPGISYEYSIQYYLEPTKPLEDCNDVFFGLSVHDAITGIMIAAGSFKTDPGCNSTDQFGRKTNSWYTYSLGYITASSVSTNVGWSLFTSNGNSNIMEYVEVRNAVFQMA